MEQKQLLILMVIGICIVGMAMAAPSEVNNQGRENGAEVDLQDLSQVEFLPDPSENGVRAKRAPVFNGFKAFLSSIGEDGPAR